MKSCALSVIAGLVLAATVGVQDLAPKPDGSMRLDVRLVMVDAQVINKKTHEIVTSIKPDDLEVYEDGIRQDIKVFSQDELPISVVMLFDLTDSVRPVLKLLGDGAQRALGRLKPQDQVAVMVYSSNARLIQDFTTDRGLAAAAIEKASRMKSEEAAFFNEAIFQAANHLENATASNTRRVIIWLTDDVPNIPSDEIKERYGRSLRDAVLHTEKEAMQELLRSGTVVCTLLKRSELSDLESAHNNSEKILGRLMYPPGEVGKYGQLTGGTVVESSSKKLPSRLAMLVDDLRRRYSLGYHPAAEKPQGKFCAIKVKLSPEAKKIYRDAVIEARQGYYR